MAARITEPADILRDALAAAHAALHPLAARIAHDADADAVHDFRVNARRARAALQLFKPALPKAARGIAKRLRALARKMAATRDLDVTRERLAQWGAELPATDLGAVTDRLARKRAALEPRIRRALGSAAARKVIDALAATPALKKDALPAGAAPALLRRIESRFRRARKRAARKRTPQSLHKLRLRGKELRYVLELLGAQGARKAALNALREMQECLGEFFDAHLVIAALKTHAPKHPMLRHARLKAASCLKAVGKLLARLDKAMKK